MQIYGLLVLASPPGAGAVPLTTAWELGSFSWLQRGTVQDMMGFMARVSIPHPLPAIL
jgi:synaptobrevin family protein YKT6